MTEYEISELIYSLIDSMATVFMAYLTIMSGYLVVAYLISNKISFVQACTINALFLSITSIQIYSNFLYAIEIGELLKRKAQISELTTFQQLVSNQYSNFGTAFLMFLGVLASLYFFYSTRRQGEK